MRTTLELPDPLFREVKARAAKQGMKLKELLASYIEAGFHGRIIPPSTSAPAGGSAPLPVAFRRDPSIPPVPARSNAELFSLLDEEDIAGYRRVAGPPPPES